MSQSEYAFPRSRVILQQLARNGQQSPPPQNGSAHEYLDSSLAIRARTSVTKDDFEARHDLQAKGIRLEFENQRKYVDRRFDELVTKEQFEQQRTYITKFQENVNQRFGDVDQRFRDIDQRFRDIDQRFDEVDQRFGDIDQRFDEVDQRFEQVYSTLDEFRTRFTQIQGESHNRQSFKGWHTIYPLGLFDPGGGFRMPANFPSTIREFWKLKLPSHMPRLISLIQFYDIQGYEWWGLEEMETDESDRGGPSRQPLSLEVAVHSYPDMGLEALAQRLGLKYQKIRDFMERVDESKRNPMACCSKT